MADYKYETWSLAEIASRVVADIIESGRSPGWRYNKKAYRDAVRERLLAFNLELEERSDGSDAWTLRKE